jgi:DNA adenine methylase
MGSATTARARSEIVNVASVPQRSPFRYPGGKTWLVPYIRLWLQSRHAPVEELIEPFAGGAIAGLTAAFEGLAKRVTLVEIDPDVAAVWRTILSGHGEWLADQILNFGLSPASVRTVLSTPHHSVRERAFATILRNRVQRGGILAPGAGLMKNGENGRGIASRWYPRTLGKRILSILTIKDRITFIQDDGMKWIAQNAHRKEAVFFIDPPYVVAGKRLYRHSHIDHRNLFTLASRVAGDFLMTYDQRKEIQALASEFGFDTRCVPMKNTHHAKMTELLVGRNFDWVLNSAMPQLAFGGFGLQTLQD